MPFAISAQAASSEVQSTPEMVPETPPEFPKTLPRATREVPGASPRPLRSGRRRVQRHLSSAWGLRSTSEAALTAFRVRFLGKSRAPSLLFFVFSCPWPLLSCLVCSVFCCFCSTLLQFCVPKLSWPFVATEVQPLLLFCVPKMPKPVVATEVQAHVQAKVARSHWGPDLQTHVIKATMQGVKNI